MTNNSNSPLGALPRTEVRGFHAPRLERRVGDLTKCALHPRAEARSPEKNSTEFFLAEKNCAAIFLWFRAFFHNYFGSDGCLSWPRPRSNPLPSQPSAMATIIAKPISPMIIQTIHFSICAFLFLSIMLFSAKWKYVSF